MLFDSVQDIGGATEHARRCRTNLDKVLPNRLPKFRRDRLLVASYPCMGEQNVPVEHGVESGDFVDTHWGKLEEFGNIVHHAYAGPSFILTLPEV